MTNKFFHSVIKIFDPFRAIKLRYLPILAIYFANSFAAFSNIAESFWIKNSLTLSASEVISITIWTNLPWSMKILFGQILDSVKILGSQRNIYIILGAIFMILGNIVTIGVANHWPAITSLGSTYQMLIIAGTLVVLGLVVQDLVADTLCYEVVDKNHSDGSELSPEQIKQEIGLIQYLARIIDLSAAIIAAFIGGTIAAKLPYSVVSYLIPIVSVISITGIIIVKKEPSVNKEPINWWILLGGISYILFIFSLSQIDFKYAQELILLIGLIIISIALYSICKPLEAQKKKEIFSIIVAFFAFRSVPTYGPAVEWWQMDVLKFEPEFFGVLSQLGIVLGFLGVYFYGKTIINYHIGKALLLINTIHVILQIPLIAMAFGLHEWTMKHFGFGAKTIIFLDSSADGPFKNLGFLVLCAAGAYYAPKKNHASWFALFFSIASLAMVSASRIIKKIIANIYIVERGQYQHIADQMIATTLINFLLPTIVILLVLNPFKKKRSEINSRIIAD